ncbi:patatin-like phospholipase family protein [Clostridium bowmanii]|uniref:patatin-like phospholipase family protein n=1 Tax=Clostridium bowmanii TaxID=132925 RepID=UPI001C0C0443|nr:patatin-like phospholipase family protein [Clostridium bowmanii]MBU3191804.1 patatin-like phospholipase family protein [Clostridium bowmanii]MCA1076102.1 patatin-like phospholipase family protein [Clostridium bowmanii]
MVFGGGGAKGAYEIGVWKALNELKIDVEVVVGTSVGALNGAIMVQGDFDVALSMWTDMTMCKVIDMGQEANFLEEKNLRVASIINIIKSSLLLGGMDVTPLKDLLYKVIDEKKIRESKIDFGIVTFSLTDFSPVNIFIKDIPEGKLVDYLLASSCFPAFKSQMIDNKRYIDGGIYNNIPISLISEKIKNIIVVDVSGVGRIKKVDTSNNKIIYIKNSQYLCGILQFEPETTKSSIEFGYFDTLRAFSKTRGKRYYIQNSEICNISENIYIDYITENEIGKIYEFYGANSKSINPTIIKAIKFRLLRNISKYADCELNKYNIFIAMLEICSECLEIERVKLYRIEELIDQIMKEYESYKNIKLETNIVSLPNKLFSINKELVYYNPDLRDISISTINKRNIIAISQPKYSIANLFLSLLLFRSIQ